MRGRDAWYIKRFAHRVEMKPNDARRETDRRDATFGGEPAHGRFAYLENFRELLRGQKLFTIWHDHFGVRRLWRRFGLIFQKKAGD